MCACRKEIGRAQGGEPAPTTATVTTAYTHAYSSLLVAWSRNLNLMSAHPPLHNHNQSAQHFCRAPCRQHTLPTTGPHLPIQAAMWGAGGFAARASLERLSTAAVSGLPASSSSRVCACACSVVVIIYQSTSQLRRTPRLPPMWSITSRVDQQALSDRVIYQSSSLHIWSLPSSSGSSSSARLTW